MCERKLFRQNPAVAKPGGGRLNIVHLPTKDGALKGREVRNFRDAYFVAADADDQGKLVEANKLKAELSFVESARRVVVLGGNKADEFARSQHGCLHG